MPRSARRCNWLDTACGRIPTAPARLLRGNQRALGQRRLTRRRGHRPRATADSLLRHKATIPPPCVPVKPATDTPAPPTSGGTEPTMNMFGSRASGCSGRYFTPQLVDAATGRSRITTCSWIAARRTPGGPACAGPTHALDLTRLDPHPADLDLRIR